MKIHNLRILLQTCFLFFSSFYLHGDPRLNFILSNLTPEQRSSLTQTAIPAIQNPPLSDTKNNQEATKSVEETATLTDSESTSEDLLHQLLFLEQLLVQDLDRYELKLEETKNLKNEIESPWDKLELSEAVEETRRLLKQIKKEQRLEISRQTSEDLNDVHAKLQPFGFDFFHSQSVDDVDVLEHIPADYKVGPGDILEILLFGQRNTAHSLLINRGGIIQFPDVGPINVFEQDRDFLSIKNTINQKIKGSLGDGVQSSITLGVLRSMPIFIVGQVKAPGRYMVSPHSSITSALRKAGGITEKGSMRKVSLKRDGKEINSLDLYDLLIRGDDSADHKLLAGDVIFVPAVGSQVLISGEIHVPALYELNGDTTLADLIKMAGGLSPHAYPGRIMIQRNNKYGRYDLQTIDFINESEFSLRGGDMIEVPRSEKRFDDAVQISGPVERPGFHQWRKGMKLSDLFAEVGFLLKEADMNFAFLVRSDEFRNLSIFKFYPREILSKKANFDVFPDDQILILSSASEVERFENLRPILLDLKKQTPRGKKALVVNISGEVHFPGEYLLADGMTVGDLVLAAGGLKDSAYEVGAELTRTETDDLKYSRVVHHRIAPTFYLEKNSTNPFLLQPYDRLNIKPTPLWSKGKFVVIEGEVNFPGTYQISRNESLAALIKRAGGLTENAFIKGAFFTRKNLVEREEKELERLMNRLQSDLASSSMDALNPAETARVNATASAMMKRLENTEPVGRMVIDMSKLIGEDTKTNLALKDGDKLIIPSEPSAVSVMGEVNFPTSHLFKAKQSRDDYIALSGGTTDNAAVENIFVVKADGSVFANNSNRWFKNKRTFDIEAGDVIVVPVDIQKSRFLEQLSYTSQIIYQLAVAAAAVNSF